MSRRQGLNPESQVTFRRLERLDLPTLTQVAARYPNTVSRAIATLLTARLPASKAAVA